MSTSRIMQNSDLFLLAPLVLLTHLFLLRSGKIILDVESFANLLWCLTLDHISNSFASHIQKSFNIEIVCCQNQFKECTLIHLEKVDALIFQSSPFFYDMSITVISKVVPEISRLHLHRLFMYRL